MGKRRRSGWWGLVAFVAVGIAACGGGGPELYQVEAQGKVVVEAADPVPAVLDPPTTTTTTTPPPPPTTAAPTTEPPPPSTEPPPEPPPLSLGTVNEFGYEPYSGLGTWVDAYDWTYQFTDGDPRVNVEEVDLMAALGVQTMYIQASKWDSPTDVLEPERLQAFIDRAHANGIRVVGWYLPTLEDPAMDLQRLLAVAALDIEGIAVDMESRKVEDIGERNARAVQLSAELRQALPGRVIGMIPLPAVVMDVVNPNYWPEYPWAAMAPYYDVWLPMSYWTNRTEASGYRDGYVYVAENIDRMRTHTGNPDLVCHALGGLGEGGTPEDVAGMYQAAAERGCIGGSLYDFRTTTDETWSALQVFRG